MAEAVDSAHSYKPSEVNDSISLNVMSFNHFQLVRLHLLIIITIMFILTIITINKYYYYYYYKLMQLK